MTRDPKGYLLSSSVASSRSRFFPPFFSIKFNFQQKYNMAAVPPGITPIHIFVYMYVSYQQQKYLLEVLQQTFLVSCSPKLYHMLRTSNIISGAQCKMKM